MDNNLIIVEVGTFEGRPGKPKAYRIYEKLTNGTWKLAKTLSDGEPNDPALFKDSRTRLAQLHSVKSYGTSEEDEF